MIPERPAAEFVRGIEESYGGISAAIGAFTARSEYHSVLSIGLFPDRWMIRPRRRWERYGIPAGPAAALTLLFLAGE